MTPADKTLLREAAGLLHQEARAMRESCELNGKPWQCAYCAKPCEAERHHQRVTRCVTQLRARAKGKP